MLWPYRRSAMKNQRRWTFGGVYPRAHARATRTTAALRAEVLLEGGATPTSTSRPLPARRRRPGAAGGEPVDELSSAASATCPGTRRSSARSGSRPLRPPIASGRRRARSVGRGGARALWEALEGAVEVSSAAAGDVRRAARSRSRTRRRGTARPRGGAAAHVLLHARGAARAGGGVRLADRPARRARRGAACRNEGTAGPCSSGAGEQHVLASPIILEDHPRIAPESPGDLFDGGEIDQLLVLNILA